MKSGYWKKDVALSGGRKKIIVYYASHAKTTMYRDGQKFDMSDNMPLSMFGWEDCYDAISAEEARKLIKEQKESMRNMVETARDIALIAHRGQKDRAGKDYYHHPVFLAKGMKTYEEKVVALLHDVLEDSDWTAEKLAEKGIPESAIEAVQLLTHDPSVPYMEYVKAIKDNPVAKKVKIADLKHNLNLTRLSEITKKDIERCRKYLDALQYLID